MFIAYQREKQKRCVCALNSTVELVIWKKVSIYIKQKSVDWEQSSHTSESQIRTADEKAGCICTAALHTHMPNSSFLHLLCPPHNSSVLSDPYFT